MKFDDPSEILSFTLSLVEITQPWTTRFSTMSMVVCVRRSRLYVFSWPETHRWHHHWFSPFDSCVRLCSITLSIDATLTSNLSHFFDSATVVWTSRQVELQFDNSNTMVTNFDRRKRILFVTRKQKWCQTKVKQESRTGNRLDQPSHCVCSSVFRVFSRVENSWTHLCYYACVSSQKVSDIG